MLTEPERLKKLLKKSERLTLRGLKSAASKGMPFQSRFVKPSSRQTRLAHYPKIPWVIACHHGGLIRHAYTARLWPTTNTGSA